MKRSVLFKLVAVNSILALCTLVAWGDSPSDDLHLQVTIKTGEHSRDSNSATRSLTVSSDKLVYEETYEGAHANRRQPVKKEFRLTKQDFEALIGLVKEKHLLTTAKISKPPTQKGTSRYFELSIHSKLNRKEATVSIDASPGATELKTDPVFGASLELIERLYKIINRTDPDITIPNLIDE